MKIIHLTPQTTYEQAIKLQEDAVADVIAGGEEILFLCEHAPVFTLGTSAEAADVLNAGEIPCIPTGRGGKVTYHGPGQLVIYPILDLSKREKDLRKYVQNLQKLIIATLKEFGIESHTDDDVGVWVSTKTGEKKIAAIGVRVRKWVTFHGVALNICPNMQHFQRIIPCGIREKGVTSMQELGVKTDMQEVEVVLVKKFEELFQLL